jgi:hypothetical protein
MEVKVGSKEEAAAVMHLVESDFFGSKLERAMKLNGRGSYVVEGEEITLSKFRTQIIPLLHPTEPIAVHFHLCARWHGGDVWLRDAQPEHGLADAAHHA